MPFEQRVFQQNRDTDSAIARKQSHETFLRFLRHAGIEGLSASDKVRWIQNIDYAKFMDMLSVMNGILISQDKFQRWKGEITKSHVTIGGGVENVELEVTFDPPWEPSEELREMLGV